MIKPGVYLHSKSGAHVRVHFVAKHSEQHKQEFVCYEHLDNHPMGKFWIRPVSMWNEIVEVGGEKKPRFVWLRDK